MISNDGIRSRHPELTLHDHLSSQPLNEIVCGAGLVLCRPGYSSVMDLLKLQKKCIFVPTPGQTEQEYLGDYLSGRGSALCRPQNDFSLMASLTAAQDFPFIMPDLQEEGDGPLRTTIREWVQMLVDRK